MPPLSTRNALIFGLALSLPISSAILIVGLADGPEPTSSAATAITAYPTEIAPTATVTVTATATPEAKAEALASPTPTTAVASKVRTPQGTVEISRWQNDIEYSASCAKLDVTIANRSDTAVDKVTLHSTGEDARDAEITLPSTTFSAGIPAFDKRNFSLKICDKRMAQNEYGPSAVPTRITWTWMSQ